jgi:hypothetical protein
MKIMSADRNGFAAPRARDIEHSRRAKVAPLLAAGLTVHAIAAETGIPVGAVHRAKRQISRSPARGNFTFVRDGQDNSPSCRGFGPSELDEPETIHPYPTKQG